MRRWIIAWTLLLLASSASIAGAVSVGVGAFGGVSVPIVQDDTDQGTVFGVRVPVSLPIITVEPYFETSKLGDKDQTIAGFSYTRDGGEITAFGANVLLGSGGAAGVSFFPYAGIGTHTLKREALEDRTEVGYNFGLGIGFSPVPKFSLNLRGELQMITTDETSRKFGNVTLGASYALFSAP